MQLKQGYRDSGVAGAVTMRILQTWEVEYAGFLTTGASVSASYVYATLHPAAHAIPFAGALLLPIQPECISSIPGVQALPAAVSPIAPICPYTPDES